MKLETIGLHHFCIKKTELAKGLISSEIIDKTIVLQKLSELDLSIIYNGDETNKDFIILTGFGEWSYILWNCWDFETNLKLTEELSMIFDTTVNYYFIDSQIATSRWVLSNSGKISRAYYESHGEILYDSGVSDIESSLRKTKETTFVEDLFWDLYQSTAVTLEDFNRKSETNLQFYRGTIKK